MGDVKGSEGSADAEVPASEGRGVAGNGSYIDGVISDFSSIGKVHDQFLDSLADNRISMLKELPQIDDKTFERISSIVVENTRTLYSSEWRGSWSEALRTHPRLEGFLVGVPLAVVPWVVVIVAFAGHHVWFPNLPTFVISALALVLCLLAVLVFVKVLRIFTWRRFDIARGLVTATAFVWLTSLMARDGNVIIPYSTRYSLEAPWVIRNFLAPVNWTAALHSAIWIVACVMLGRALYLMAMGIVRVVILSEVIKESGGVMSTAKIQDLLLITAYTLHQHLSAVRSGNQASVPSSVRTGVIKDIAKLADMIEHSWVRSVRTGYRPTDESVEQTALAVATKIRSMQPLVVFGGRNLDTVCDEFVHVYLLTVDGAWSSISTELYSGKKSWSSHARDILRKLLALSFPGISAWVLISLPIGPFATYRPIIVGSAALITLIELLALVDPDIVSKINGAVSLSNFMSRSPKP